MSGWWYGHSNRQSHASSDGNIAVPAAKRAKHHHQHRASHESGVNGDASTNAGVKDRPIELSDSDDAKSPTRVPPKALNPRRGLRNQPYLIDLVSPPPRSPPHELPNVTPSMPAVSSKTVPVKLSPVTSREMERAFAELQTTDSPSEVKQSSALTSAIVDNGPSAREDHTGARKSLTPRRSTRERGSLTPNRSPFVKTSSTPREVNGDQRPLASHQEHVSKRKTRTLPWNEGVSFPPGRAVRESNIDKGHKNITEPVSKRRESAAIAQDPRSLLKTSGDVPAELLTPGPEDHVLRTIQQPADIVRAVLQQMKSDHARTVKSLLKDARISSSANQDSLSTSMMPPTSTSMEAHDQPMSSSPFASLGNIENAGLVTNYTLQGPTGRLKIQEFKGSAKISKVPITICKFEEALIPCYTSFTTLQDNLLIDDDEYLRYWPYFGDQDGDYDNNRVNHHFKNQVRDLPALHHEAEQAARHRPYIERILIETGCDPVDVLHYMTLESSSDIWRESAQLSSALERRQSKMHPRQTPPKELAKVTNHLGLPHPSKLLLGATVYLEFTERTQPSVWPGFCRELLRIQGAKVERTMHNIGLPSATRQLSSKLHALSLETYTTLGCLVCHRHECPGHGEFYLKNEEDHIRRRVVGPTEEEMASVPLPARMDQETEHCTAVQPCSRQCCRHTNDALQQDPFGPTQTVWTKADAALVEKLSSAYLDYREACCVMSFLIRKPCIEIHRKVYAMRKHDPSNGIELFAAKKRLSMPRIDMLETKTANLDEREPFTPCHHAGPCTTLCSCYQNDVACEKSCLCAWDCSRRFRGCNCAVAGRLCQTRKCTCVNFNRECDPDVCGPCGAAEILEPGRLAQGDQALPLERQCCNVNVQLGRPKRTILGTSEVAGYGLFMGEPAQKGDYLGQYLGEVISTDEANRRGSIYDQRQLSYLFDLNKDQVVDASRAGNKFRFINNSELAFNCRPKVLLVNGVHHIAMFADKDLVPGEELFFNYGYGRENRKFVSIEPGSRKGGKAPLTIPPRIVEEDGSDPEHRPRGKARVVKKKKLKPFKEKGIGVKGHRRGKQIIKGTRNVPPNDLGLGTDSAEVLSRESIPSPAVERNDEDVAQWFLDQAAKFHRGLPSDFNTSTHAERPDPSRFPSINGEPHEHPLPASSQVSQLRATPPRAPDEDQVMLDLDADPLPEEDEPDSEDVYDPTKEAAPDEDEDFEDEADVEEVERGRRRKGRGGGVRVVQGRGKKAPKARVVTGRGRGWRRGVARKSTFH